MAKVKIVPEFVRDHPIRAFAVLCVAAIAIYLGWMGYKINETLSSSDWCRTALGAEKASSVDSTIKGLEACIDLLTLQLKSVATNSHITFGAMALCLVALIVIVIAKGKAVIDIPGGGNINLSPADDAARAAAAGAAATAAAASTTAAEIATTGTAPPPAAPPEPEKPRFTPPPGSDL